jgi:hypothetical protein
MARVRILVDGPQNAVVRIDGVAVQWFGMQELAVGEHQFEFLPPPDDVCCKSGQKKTVQVPPPSGPDDVYKVRGRIEFNPATLDLQGPPGSAAICGTLGEFPVPTTQQVPMSEASLSVRCQLLPPPGSSDPPKPFDVTLRPGQLSTNPR